MMQGKVRIWSRTRAFGFIEGEDGRVYFAHRGQVLSREDLRRGQRVAFTPAEAPRGPRATAVRVIEPPPRAQGQLETVLSGARCLEHLVGLAGPTVAACAFATACREQ
jgi:CspA family cold shock protein